LARSVVTLCASADGNAMAWSMPRTTRFGEMLSICQDAADLAVAGIAYSK
jgi:hypothetical protein